MSSKQKAIFVLAAILVGAFLFYNFADQFATWCRTGDTISVAVAYLLLTPLDVLLLILMFKTKGIRGFIAGLFILIALDMISFPHYIPQSGAMPQDASSYVGMDSILYRAFPNYPLGTIGLYILTPAILLIIAFEIVYPSTFISLVRKGVVA